MKPSRKFTQQEYIDYIERLNGGALDRLDWNKLYGLLETLTEGLPVVLHPFSPTDKVGRGRVLSSPDKFPTIDTLGYPPTDKCKDLGRCNRPQSPVLYAGVGTELIFSEIGAKVGDYVGLLHMSPAKPILCVYLGALNSWRRTSGHCLMHDDVKEQISAIYRDPSNICAFLFDAFISDYFSRMGHEAVYKLTSAYTSVMLNAHPDIAGLLYESVDHTAGTCVAIKPEVFDNLMQPTEVQILKVTNYLGYGIYEFEQVAFSNKFDGKTILWE